MTKVRVMLKCTLGPLARRKVERDFDDEVRFHLQMETENNLRKGMTEEEARNRALAQFGRVAAVKETCRETRSLPWMEVLWQELGFGMRMLRRSPGFAALTVLCLTLGIGASTSALSWLEVICVRRGAGRCRGRGRCRAGSEATAGSAGVAPRTLDGHNRN